MLRRLLTEDVVLIDPEVPELPEECEPDSNRAKRLVREWWIGLCAELLDRGGKVSHLRRLTEDLDNREKRATMLIGEGVALPHVRTMQARELAAAAIVFRTPVDLGAPDEEPIRLILAVVSPPYDDQSYLKLYKRLGAALKDTELLEWLEWVENPGEVVRLLASV
jgi:mannitol/fructose-specific phosphotransferase system IIA component (Ntr-type)